MADVQRGERKKAEESVHAEKEYEWLEYSSQSLEVATNCRPNYSVAGEYKDPFDAERRRTVHISSLEQLNDKEYIILDSRGRTVIRLAVESEAEAREWFEATYDERVNITQ